MLNSLQFGEEIFPEENENLGEKDEVAGIVLCALCGAGTVALCAAAGCEILALAVGVFSSFASVGPAELTAFGAAY